jgi:hypothetical protein
MLSPRLGFSIHKSAVSRRSFQKNAPLKKKVFAEGHMRHSGLRFKTNFLDGAMRLAVR